MQKSLKERDLRSVKEVLNKSSMICQHPQNQWCQMIGLTKNDD
jgi:hypothetical protein